MAESRGNKLETYSISVDVGGTNLRVAAHTRSHGLSDMVKVTKTCGGESAHADRACAT
jgi:hypothetical protein